MHTDNNTTPGIFSRKNIIRLLLLIGATAIILLMAPRTDHESFNYELNQPWKYQLLTAEFDTPVLRDSASQRAMRDSIENNFAPFVKRNTQTAAANVQRLRNALSQEMSDREVTLLTRLLAEAYGRGIVSSDLYNEIHTGNNHRVRHYNGDEDPNDRSVTTMDGSGYLAPRDAFNFIDSAYSAAIGITADPNSHHRAIPASVAKSITVCIVPDIIVDTAINDRFRDQEYLNVNGALGVIKKGQRIVDRGEIVNAQIFTNLNTYQDMLNKRQSSSNSMLPYITGQGIYILLCLLVLYLFLHNYRSRFFGDVRKMTFLMTFITFFVIITALMFEYVPQGIYLVPFAAVPVVILVFFDSRTAIFSLLVTVMLAALMATYPYQFIFLELLAGCCATVSIHQLSRRSQLLRTAVVSMIAYAVGFAAVCLMTDGNLYNFTGRMALMFLFNAIILSFAYVLILIIEKLFGFTSTVTLVELSDINNPLLRRLAEDAPGTFQHSMQVSTLAAEAARAIGANTQLVRTGALYHDIGKMENPVFFTENQHGVNPHAGLDPETSAAMIIRHVTDGVSLASKSKLPAVIKDFITEHHGKGVTKYFYNTAVNESDGRPVDRSKFMYPGPNPRSKETAILMMADAVEAASRSLKDHTPGEIDALVDKIIDGQVADGMFKDAPISFRDIETIKKTFKSRLATIYHSRIAYPDLKSPEPKPEHPA